MCAGFRELVNCKHVAQGLIRIFTQLKFRQNDLVFFYFFGFVCEDLNFKLLIVNSVSKFILSVCQNLTLPINLVKIQLEVQSVMTGTGATCC